MGGLIRFVAALSLVLFAASAQASPRISLAMKGDTKSLIATQLAGELCGTFECVLRTKVFTGARPDFSKARQQRVKGILYGFKKPGDRTVTLVLLTKPGRPTMSWRFPLTRQGTLKQSSIDQLMRDLQGRLGSAPAPAHAPAPVARPAPERTAPPPAAPASVAPAPAPEEVASTPAPEPAREPVREPAPAPASQSHKSRASASSSASSSEAGEEVEPRGSKKENRQYLVAAEVGYYGTRRELSYSGIVGGVSDLLAYKVNLVSSPRARLELFPLYQVQGIVSGLGLFGEYSTSVGLNTESAGTKRTSSFSRLQAGVTWRILPISTSRLVLAPSVSFQRLRFTVDGGLPGLPNALLSGVKGSLGIEIPVGGQVTILLGGGYVSWSGAKDLIGADFFADGSAHALEAEGGLSVALSRSISLRVLAEYSATRYSLKNPLSVTYSASEAKDDYLGGRAMLRLQY